MKKLCFLLSFVFSIATMDAQNFLSENTLEVMSEKTPSTEATQISNKAPDINFNVEYQFIEKGWGVGFNQVVNWFFWGMAYTGTDDVKGVIEDIRGINANMGACIRHYIGKSFYVKGRCSLGYLCTMYNEVRYESSYGKKLDDKREHDFYFTIEPKIGIELFKVKNTRVGIECGYRLDFMKFKFDSDHKSDYFTLGLCFNY